MPHLLVDVGGDGPLPGVGASVRLGDTSDIPTVELTQRQYCVLVSAVNPTPREYIVTLDWTGSENVRVQPKGTVTTQKGPWLWDVVLGPGSGGLCQMVSVLDTRCQWVLRCTGDTTWRPAGHDALGVTQELRRVKDLAASSVPLVLSNVLSQCAAAPIPFVDVTFPPNKVALQQAVDDVEWRRPEEFVDLPPSDLLASLVAVSYPPRVVLGPLHNRGVHGGLLLLAERPEAIQSAIPLPQDGAGHGALTVNLCRHGWWEPMLLDTYLPCKAGTGSPAYTSCLPVASGQEASFLGTGELWAACLEKALAKLYGGYLSLADVDVGRVLGALTGCPTSHNWLPDDPDAAEGLWSELQSRLQRGHMVCGTLLTPEDLAVSRRDYRVGTVPDAVKGPEGRARDGFCDGSSYAILSAVEYLPPTGGTGRWLPRVKPAEEVTEAVRLVKLRNLVDADKEWCGAWGCRWNGWTSAAKESLGFEGLWDERAFYMPWGDFRTRMDRLTWCAYEPTWSDVRVEGEFSAKGHPSACFKYTQKVEGPITVVVSQPDPLVTRSRRRMPYSCVGVYILKPTDTASQEYQFHACSEFSQRREVWVECQLPVARRPYLIVPVAYHQCTVKKYVLTVRSPTVESTDVEAVSGSPELVQKSEVVTGFAEGVERVVGMEWTVRLHLVGPLCIVVALNASVHRVWEAQLDFTSAAEWVAVSGSLEAHIEVGPRGTTHVGAFLYTGEEPYPTAPTYVVQWTDTHDVPRLHGEAPPCPTITINPNMLRLVPRPLAYNGCRQESLPYVAKHYTKPAIMATIRSERTMLPILTA